MKWLVIFDKNILNGLREYVTTETEYETIKKAIEQSGLTGQFPFVTAQMIEDNKPPICPRCGNEMEWCDYLEPGSDDYPSSDYVCLIC